MSGGQVRGFVKRTMTWTERSGLVVIVSLGLLSLLLMEQGYQAVTQELRFAVASMDNLTRSRLHVSRAYLEAVRSQAGDPIFQASRSQAELAEAAALLEDWIGGRSTVLDLEAGEPATREDQEKAAHLIVLIREFGELLADPAPDPFLLRLGFTEMERNAGDLERSVHQAVQGQLSSERRRHRIRLLLWTGFIGLASLGFMALRGLEGRARFRRDQLEKQRDTARQRYASLLEVSPTGLLRCGPLGRVQESNPWWCEQMGGDRKHWNGRHWWSALPPTVREQARESWNARSPHRRAFSLELEGHPTDGSPRWYLFQWSPRPAEGDQAPSQWLGTVLDISDRHRVESQLQQAQKLEAVGQLTGGLSHDFNNLLTVILTNTEFLIQDLSEEEPLELVNDIRAAAEGGRDLIQGLMVFSRQAALSIQPLDLSSTVEDAIRLGRRMVPPSIELDWAAEAPGPKVLGDPGAIQQILLNLISNARDAMPRGGRIRVTVDREIVEEEYVEDHPWFEPGAYGVVAVSDNGSGMDKETAARVFDPFFTTKELGKGTGLGLSTVHGLIRQMGGYIHVYSEPNQGAVFRFFIPASTAEGRHARSEPAGERRAFAGEGSAGSETSSRPCVLLVDDDPMLRRTATRVLERLGYRVRVVGDGLEALEVLEGAESVDLVLSDVAMEGMGGLELYHQMADRGIHLPFIFNSGYTSEQMDARDDLPLDIPFLAKPWTVEQVSAALEAALGHGTGDRAPEGPGEP